MRNKGGAATLLRQTRTKRWRCYRVNSIKWDYWQNVGAARDEYTTAKLALHSMSKRSNGYSRQLEHVDSLRNKFINRSVSFICRESRAERPRMWSAFYLSMLDLDKINQDDSHDYTNYLVMEYLVRALGWDSAPIGDNNPLFTCDDFHKYINLDSCLDVERPSVAGLWAIVKMLEEMGGVAARNAETIALHYLVDAAAKSGDDKYMWKYVQQFRYDDDEKDSIEEHIFSPAASPAGKRSSQEYAYGQNQTSPPACAHPSKQSAPVASLKPHIGGGTKSPHAKRTETRCWKRTQGRRTPSYAANSRAETTSPRATSRNSSKQ